MEPAALIQRVRSRRPSAVLVLGTLSGLLAGVLYMAISFPLVAFAVDAAQSDAISRSSVAVDAIEQGLVTGTVFGTEHAAQLGIDWFEVALPDGGMLYRVGATDDLVDAACAMEPAVVTIGEDAWAVACRRTATHRIAAGVAPDYRLGRQILAWTFTLALVVGLVTALGQARLLRPLTTMSDALQRVGRGERNLHLGSTGLAEFDEVVDRINEAARHVEDRVDGITARITVVQEMARMVAHEVRNPLQSLELLTSLIEREPNAAERQALAQSIHEEIRALDQVVHRLLKEGASTGALRLQRKRQVIAVLVEQAARRHQPEAQRRGVRLSVGLLSRDEASVDAAMFGRSIENLVQNALHAVSDRTGEVRLSVYRDSDRLHLVVDDNGPGVDAQLGDRIFESGTTGRPDGHGLGLALVRAVMLAHDGSIEYSKSPLGGARFQATLPLAEAEEEA